MRRSSSLLQTILTRTTKQAKSSMLCTTSGVGANHPCERGARRFIGLTTLLHFANQSQRSKSENGKTCLASAKSVSARHWGKDYKCYFSCPTAGYGELQWLNDGVVFAGGTFAECEAWRSSTDAKWRRASVCLIRSFLAKRRTIAKRIIFTVRVLLLSLGKRHYVSARWEKWRGTCIE